MVGLYQDQVFTYTNTSVKMFHCFAPLMFTAIHGVANTFIYFEIKIEVIIESINIKEIQH